MWTSGGWSNHFVLSLSITVLKMAKSIGDVASDLTKPAVLCPSKFPTHMPIAKLGV